VSNEKREGELIRPRLNSPIVSKGRRSKNEMHFGLNRIFHGKENSHTRGGKVPDSDKGRTNWGGGRRRGREERLENASSIWGEKDDEPVVGRRGLTNLFQILVRNYLGGKKNQERLSAGLRVNPQGGKGKQIRKGALLNSRRREVFKC